MMYIKLEEDLSLTITVKETIHRGDNLSTTLTFLLPETINDDITTISSSIYMNYIRADGKPDVVTLERQDEMYEAIYHQYTAPVTCKMTYMAGTVVMWLQIMSGTLPDIQSVKSGECILQVTDAFSIDDYLPQDLVMTAFHQLKTGMDSSIESINSSLSNLDDITDALNASKADSMTYDSETHELQLTAQGEPVGDPAIITTN